MKSKLTPMATTHFPDVTLLITHYNRSKSLERLLQAFQDLKFSFGDIVVSDDCSKPQHIQALEALQQRFTFRIIYAEKNKGLGNNINKGQDAVQTPYTLYVQEDFVPTSKFLQPYSEALAMLEQEPELDIARFYAYYAYPYLQPYRNGFSKMLYKPWFTNTGKIYIYSDHPHLRRSSFFSKFGRYVEGIKSDKTEYLMCISFIQKKGQAIFYNDFKSLFLQENSSEEPSTVTRANWRQSNNIFVAGFRTLYRQVKYNYDIHLH